MTKNSRCDEVTISGVLSTKGAKDKLHNRLDTEKHRIQH